ncbi:hypothetical protein TTHERM_00456880 (macronuclear) [Tetrahymena thermophila SB210]|uniref:Uncharacterized protein n=1 Tax=Tetrahymena thermophila (strain SB210) TaxID=312017 RepID=I7LX85_TETTS|nr:hypothetical protein TTHERM_00456880 [Tetrahymena thermophila SB210]EAS03950.2 hypothetical protein TTHERM_00456880 [Tetrahymena thermophila SB210]|eukprot:XP_001024195.2 hypothetical protein TTHERM_00456880 [Tetrahymena thermophila SB210]
MSISEVQESVNIQNLLKISKNFLYEDLEIKSKEQWQELLRFLYINKMILLDDLKSIDHNILIYPVSLEHFLRIITQSFNEKEIKDLEANLCQLMIQINDCKNMLSFWNTGKLSNQELKCLLIIFEKILQELQKIQDDFEEYNRTVQNTRENVQQLKDVFEDIEDHQAFKTAHDYQKDDAYSIGKEYHQNRTRDVHYRNQPIKVIKTFANGIVRQIGYDIDQDFPVEVVKIPKLFSDFEVLESKLNSFNAYKELIFSKYFPNYIGFNSFADQLYNLYFMEFTRGKSLKKLLIEGKNRLHPGMGLFRYWMREIFLAFKDILHKTTYVPETPITLKRIYVHDKLKVYIKNLEFPILRRTSQHSHEKLEALLLRNYGILLLQILGLQEDEIDQLNKYIEFKNFVTGMLLAEEDLQQYFKKEVKQRLTFENLLYHHLLDEQYILELDELELVNNYEYIFNNEEFQELD